MVSDEVIISAILSLGIGIILGYFFHLKGKEKKAPQCCYITHRQIEKLSSHNESPVRILYDGQEVEQVYTTYVWLWNNGRKAITREDLRTQARLSLSMGDKNPNFKILDYKVIKTTRPEIQFVIALTTGRSLAIEFEFLNHNDGGLIEIQHNGDQDTGVIIDGAIIEGPNEVGAKKLNEDALEEIFTNKKENTILKNISRGITLVGFVSILVFGLLLSLLSIYPQALLHPYLDSSLSGRQLISQNIREEFPTATEQQVENIVIGYYLDTIGSPSIPYFIAGPIVSIASLMMIITVMPKRKPHPKSLSLDEDNNNSTKLRGTNNQLEPVEELEKQIVTNEKERVVFEQTHIVGMKPSDIHKYRGDLFKSEEEVRQIHQDLMNRIHQSPRLRNLLKSMQGYYYPPGYEQQSNESRPDIHEH